MYIIIFKTNISSQEQSLRLQTMLGKLQEIVMSSFDLEDCDRILRIVSTNPDPEIICELFRKQGFKCEIMESFVFQEQA